MKNLSPDELDIVFSPRSNIISSAFPSVKPSRDNLLKRDVIRNSHTFPELVLILSGEAEMSLCDNVYYGKPGTLFLFNVREVHDSGYSSDAPRGRHLWIFPMPDAFSAKLLEVNGDNWCSVFHLLKRDSALMSCFSVAWRDCYNNPGIFTRERLLRQIDMLFISAADIIINGEPDSEISHQREAVEAVMLHLNQTLGAGDTIKDLARLTGFSRSHFLRIFYTYAGCTVREYIDRQRLSAMREFADSNLLQKEIAERLGFSSSAAFAHWRTKIKHKKLV